MRLRFLIPVLLIACLAGGGVVTAHASGDREKSFAGAATQLRAEWDRDQAAGVPAASLAPLRAELAREHATDAWWSPGWLGDDGHVLLDRLRGETQSAWNAALAGARAQAQAVLAEWSDFATRQSAWLSGATVAAAAGWPGQLSSESSPAAVSALAATWGAFLAGQRTAVAAAQQAALAVALRSAGGPQKVLATARRLVAVSVSANLDAGDVQALASRLSSQLAAGDTAGAITTGGQLVPALSALQALVDLNNQVDAEMLPLLWSVDQAEAERTPHAAAIAGARSAAAAQFAAARTTTQIDAAATAVTALRSQVAAELAANQCGHPVGTGKVITISLSLQEMVFYQDGCVARATPVTTGRPQLRTPTGRFSIFYKKTPFTFVSPWPPSSPFYYFPSPVSWVMEFASGGYFIHDAPWEASRSYGPGGEDNLAAASHGCVHTPTPVMQWAFAWTPVGTPVVISA